MKWAIAGAALFLLSASSAALAGPPLRDPASLNIGFVCEWQPRCMSQQKKAMKRSLKLVRKYQPATWRIEMCNRNASRNRYRVDWIGFENCIRNLELRPAPVPARSIVVTKKRTRSISEGAAPAKGSRPAIALGERG